MVATDITDQQHREVAERLRGSGERTPLGTLDELMDALRNVDAEQSYALTLADLIDRPTCFRDAGWMAFACSHCGVECIGPEDSYCPCCGAEVIDDDDYS